MEDRRPNTEAGDRVREINTLRDWLRRLSIRLRGTAQWLSLRSQKGREPSQTLQKARTKTEGCLPLTSIHTGDEASTHMCMYTHTTDIHTHGETPVPAPKQVTSRSWTRHGGG